MPEITKRRVTCTTWTTSADAKGDVQVSKHEVVDFVRPDFLDAYVADAQAKWQSVVVSDKPDAGPGGYEGATSIPAHLDHPQAGEHFPATTKKKD